MPFPPPTYSKASLQDTAGLIPSDAFRAIAYQVLVHVTTHSWALCVLPALEHRLWQPDQSCTNVWMSRIRRSAVVVHQLGARCKPGCPVPSQRTTLLQCSERTSDRHLVRPVYSDCPLKWSYHSRPGHVGTKLGPTCSLSAREHRGQCAAEWGATWRDIKCEVNLWVQ